MGRSSNLKRRLSAALLGIAGLATLVSGALVLLTSKLHTSSARVSAAVECVRLSEEAQRDLLLFDRVRSAGVRAEVAGDVRDRLARSRRHITTVEQADALARAEREVADYFSAARTDPTGPLTASLHDAAYRAASDVVAVNLAEAEAERATAARWDEIANVFGASIAFLVTGVVIALVWWIRTRAFRPLFDLSAAMHRFGAGATSARAPEEGPDEIAEMARRFNQMADALVRQREVQRTFIAGVAHDLRNPLGALKLSTDVLDIDEPTPDRTRRVLGVVRRQVGRLERMVSDLLDTANLEAGQLSLRLERHDARELAKDVVRLFEDSSTVHRLTLTSPSAPVLLRCDAMRVEQVLSNLVSNALKYSPQGGNVTVAVTQADREVVLSVSDDGIGMSEEEVARVFEPFRREAKVRDDIPGTGLGLFVAKRLVEAHGGRIAVTSAPGRGSRFEVHLPEEPRTEVLPEEAQSLLH